MSVVAPTTPNTTEMVIHHLLHHLLLLLTTPSGIAELLEVSFVQACIQLASGYVDILKMFIAASVAAYENGFSIPTMQQELQNCQRNTANRPLLPEEITLRNNWLSIVYLTLAAMNHIGSPHDDKAAASSVPTEIRQQYQDLVKRVGDAYQKGQASLLSVEDLLAATDSNTTTTTTTTTTKKDPRSELETAILAQSLRVAILTPIVVQEEKDARGDDTVDTVDVDIDHDLPKPPIKGAFEE
eukprot:CAMPEP_0178839296 /NCGR_PEP_ID=MMETSP0746-20121128/13790_1 /TAXON_ID=913974 /ORGANISM="Nitzschia punctata, Strain CCMP561" /LENGTH=240 /DNA_ID=CAMNT_0020502339 /DNA_START=11 /DNA_END=733 /DNA_ORIENTATION=+